MIGVSISAWTRDLISALIGLWIVIGIFIDGWAHVNLIDSLETFFSPWHAGFYSGMVAFALWVGIVWRSNGRRFPAGYLAGAAGVAIFAAGGAFDMFWHTLLGFESSIDALLSPPHLILLSGVLLITTTGWRSQRASSPTATIPELISLTSVVAICAFFVNFLSPFRRATPTLAYNPFGTQDEVVQWVGCLIVFTVLFLVPILWQLRDGRGRAGTLTAFTVACGLGVVLAMSEGWDKDLLLIGVAGAVIGAMVSEILLARAPWRTWRYGLPIIMGATAFLIWFGQFIGYALAAPILWPVTLWAGSLVFAAGAGAALGAVAWHPTRSPS